MNLYAQNLKQIITKYNVQFYNSNGVSESISES